MNMFHNILARLKASSFWKSVATLSAGQIIGQAIGLLSTPIASRLYSVDAYGNFGIITSTATIIIGLIGLGLGSAIMAPSDDEESKCILRTSFILQAVLATLVVLSLLLISNTYRPFETDVPYWLAILFMYVYILATILNSYMAVYINKLGKNKVLFVNPLISACCTLGITIPLGFKHMETAGLMCASIVSPIIASLHMGRLKLMTIVGTRPEIIRLAAIIKKCDKYFCQILVHTGQNYDYELNQVFFNDLGLRKPDFYLNAVGKDLGETVGNIIAKSYALMKTE